MSGTDSAAASITNKSGPVAKNRQNSIGLDPSVDEVCIFQK